MDEAQSHSSPTPPPPSGGRAVQTHGGVPRTARARRTRVVGAPLVPSTWRRSTGDSHMRTFESQR